MQTKPQLSIVVYLLSAIVAAGLLALGIAAFFAFHQVTPFVQALLTAILIEAGMVVEAISLVRRNYLAIIGLVISLVVSATYNYIQVQQAALLLDVPITNPWQLGTLAVGPLSALFSIALAIGFELARYENDLKAWTTAQAERVEREAGERAKREEADRQRREQEARELREAQAKREEEERVRKEKEARELREFERESQERMMRLQLENDRLMERDRQRRESRERRRDSLKRLSETGETSHYTAGSLTETDENSHEIAATYDDYVMEQMGRNGAGPMTPQEIVERFGVSRSTAYRWDRKYHENPSTAG